SVTQGMAGVGVVLSTIGPFARQAGRVIDACLAAKVPYVDIANEWPAVRGLLDRDEQAHAHAVTLVTGAGFGPAATETLVLRLVERLGVVPDLVRVAAAAGVTRHSDGARQTIQESLSRGVTLTYRDDQMVEEAIGSGATLLTFGGAQRQMLPGPVGDLETARLASGAANVMAYITNPAERSSGTDSYTWAEVTGPDGQTLTTELHTGEGVRATAPIAAETTRARPGRGQARRVDRRPAVRRRLCHRCHRRASDRGRQTALRPHGRPAAAGQLTPALSPAGMRPAGGNDRQGRRRRG